jgi:bacterial/archaeal transporter family-2 protein
MDNGGAVPGAYVNAMFYLLVVGAGVSVALQQVLNANFRMELGSPWLAGFISYLTGTVAMLAIALTSGEPWLPEAMVARTSWITWTGGIFGAIFIGTAIFMVPRVGAATVLALIVVGQMLGSLVFDHFGLLGVPQHPGSVTRLAGTAFLILGVVLIRA